MAKDPLSARPDFSRTFTIALWTLGLAAGAQAVTVGWTLATRQPRSPLAPPAAFSPGDFPLASADAYQPAPPPGLPDFSPPIPPASGEAAPLPEKLVDPPPSSSISSPPDALDLALPLLRELPPASFPGLPGPPLSPDDAATPPSGETVLTGPSASRSRDSPLPAPSFRGPESAAPPLSAALAEAALASSPALDIAVPETARLVHSGAERRASGNMAAALDDLRSAEAMLPEHPRILAEIAATYADLGLDRRASLYWERLRDLGPAAAGAWHDIALRELDAIPAAARPASTVLSLGQVSAAPDLTATRGERVVLNVAVDADPASRPDPEEMAMLVYFYDLVDGVRVEPSTLARTSQNFISPPYDWLDGGRELIEVIYLQPEIAGGGQSALGERAYYGYIIELYYRDQLQDTAAFPPDLQSLQPGASPAAVNEPLFGPENSLFPAVPALPDLE